MYQQIVFADGDDYYEAEATADEATRQDGGDAWWPGLYRGTKEWWDAMLEYLTQWDYGEPTEDYDEPPWGGLDYTYEKDGYVVSWNSALGYVGLCRKVDASETE